MSARPSKRPRPDADTDAVDPSTIPQLVNSVDSKTIANLLITAAKAYPEIASLVQHEVDRIAAAERAKVIDFDYLSKSVWKTLNVTYNRMRDSVAFEMSGEAARSIEGDIKTIKKKCTKNASFETKKNALETLRKIAKSICLSDGIMGHEIRKSFQWDPLLMPTMLDIAKSLTVAEIERLRPWCDDKLVELYGISDGYCIFENVDQVILLWNRGEDGEEEGSSDYSEESEDEDGDEDGDEEGVEDNEEVEEAESKGFGVNAGS